MHKIAEKEFTLEDFSHEHLDTFVPENEEHITIEGGKFISLNTEGHLRMVIHHLNFNREKYLETKDKKYWWQMIQLLPSSYNQTRNVMLNYEALANIYKSRKDHKLDEWREFCKWIESLPYSELVVSVDIMSPEEMRKELKLDSGTLDIRWAEDIFKNHGIKLTEAQIDAINSTGTTNVITSEEMVNVYGRLVPKKEQRGKRQLINGIDPDTATGTAVDYAVQMAKDAAKHYSFEKEE